MKMRTTLMTLMLGGLLASASAMANHRHDPAASGRYFMELQRELSLRIRQGVGSGELTRQEAKRLRAQQRRLAKRRRHYLRDGLLSCSERRDLRGRYRKAEQRIWRLRHNDRVADNRVLRQDRPITGGWYNGRGRDLREDARWRRYYRD